MTGPIRTPPIKPTQVKQSQPGQAPIRSLIRRLIPEDEDDGIPLTRREMYALVMDARGGDLIRAKIAAYAWWGVLGRIPSTSEIVATVKRIDEAVTNAYRCEGEPLRHCRPITRTSTAARARLWLSRRVHVALEDVPDEDSGLAPDVVELLAEARTGK